MPSSGQITPENMSNDRNEPTQSSIAINSSWLIEDTNNPVYDSLK